MKKVIMALFAAFTSVSIVHAAEVSITLSNINEENGGVVVGLYNKKEDFPKVKQAYQTIFIDRLENNVQCTFTDIPNGTYAVAVFHDTNSNGALDKNFFGVPNEPYGFSNNADGSFGPPPFNKAKFELTGKQVLMIKLK